MNCLDDEERKPKGEVLFTGPDGISDYKVNVEEQFSVGHGSLSPEATSDTQYLYRAAPSCPHPPPKTARVGEVGWGTCGLTDHSLLKSGQQIKLLEFRQAVEDRHTHQYQNPYYVCSPPSATDVHVKTSVVVETATTRPKDPSQTSSRKSSLETTTKS